MKTSIICISLLLFAALLSNCSASRKVAPVPGDAQLAMAKSRWPEANLANLENGKRIFSDPCTKCHGMSRIESHSEQEWMDLISDMSQRAKITPSEKNDLTMYVISMRLSIP